MSKHYYFQKLLSGEIVSDEEYKKIIIIKLNKHLRTLQSSVLFVKALYCVVHEFLLL